MILYGDMVWDLGDVSFRNWVLSGNDVLESMSFSEVHIIFNLASFCHVLFLLDVGMLFEIGAYY